MTPVGEPTPCPGARKGSFDRRDAQPDNPAHATNLRSSAANQRPRRDRRDGDRGRGGVRAHPAGTRPDVSTRRRRGDGRHHRVGDRATRDAAGYDGQRRGAVPRARVAADSAHDVVRGADARDRAHYGVARGTGRLAGARVRFAGACDALTGPRRRGGRVGKHLLVLRPRVPGAESNPVAPSPARAGGVRTTACSTSTSGRSSASLSSWPRSPCCSQTRCAGSGRGGRPGGRSGRLVIAYGRG